MHYFLVLVLKDLLFAILILLCLMYSIFTHSLRSFQVMKDGLQAVHVPYSYGFAIILLTLLVKAATFPLTKQQVSL